MQILGSYPSTSPSLLFWITVCILFIGSIILISGMINEKMAVVSITAMICLIGLVLLFIVPQEIPNGKTAYVVEMNEAINYNEFYEKYKVIEHYEYTNIYVVEEK